MRRAGAMLAILAMLAVACTEGDEPGLDFPSTQATTPSPEPEPPPIDRSADSSATAMAALCEEPLFPSPSPVYATGDVEPEIARLQRWVQAVRELEYLEPVATEALSAAELSGRVTTAFEIQYPKDLYARRTRAWTTIGVLPEGTGLREALLAYGESGVIGYYDPATGELVYIGAGDLGFNEAFTLAHELTHAIDDQHFDLTRLDPLVNGCRDEEFLAALGVVEGSAQFFSTAVFHRFPAPTGTDDIDVAGGVAALEQVPPFLLDLQAWPYAFGHGFIIALERRGGIGLVNTALRRFPASTEQVLHPERYPNDRPRPVDVPALDAPAWEDLDVMQVGEEWLRAMLRLRVDDGTSSEGAAGWDGGVYRAFVNDDRVAVAMRAVWDSPTEARQFRDAMELWIGEGNTTAAVRLEGDMGTLSFFATDSEALELLSSAF